MKLDKIKLQRYAEIKVQMSTLKKEMDELNPLIQFEMEENKVDEIESDFGKFYFKKQRSWTYPDNVLKLESEYKAQKKESEQKGTASYIETNVLTFKSLNDKKDKED